MPKVPNDVRIAMRVSGAYCNAYLGKIDTMKGAILIGSIITALVQDNVHIKNRFLNLLKDAVKASAKDIGLEISGWKTRIADCDAALTAAPTADDGWELIATAPTDGTLVLIYVLPYEDLKGFQCVCAYHPDAGWCADEFRSATHWRPLPKAPKAPKKGGA